MSSPQKKEEEPKEKQQPKAVCSFDYKKLTPWDPCWEKYKNTMVPTACGRAICYHHKLSHIMMECPQCQLHQMPAINAFVAKAAKAFESDPEDSNK